MHFDILTAGSDLLGSLRIDPMLVDPMDEIAIHLVVDTGQLSNGAALNHTLDIGIPQSVGIFRRQPTFNGSPDTQRSAFSILKQYGGKTFAIYPSGDERAFEQVNNLIKDGRIDMFACADYSKGTTAHMWLTQTVKEIAERIYNKSMEQVRGAAGSVPSHLT